MNPSRNTLAMVVGILFVVGCGQKADRSPAPKVTAELTWTGYGTGQKDPDAALYILDGKAMGKGEVGFELAMETIARLPEGSELFIYPDGSVEWERFDAKGGRLWPSGHEADVPFRFKVTLIQRMQAVTRQRRIKAWYLAGPPGTVVYDNGVEPRERAN